MLLKAVNGIVDDNSQVVDDLEVKVAAYAQREAELKE
jgi:hypothetical protein